MAESLLQANPLGVLICDDDAEIRSVLTEMIVLEPGLTVLGHAQDGNEAIAQAKLLQPDVIILDLAMPNRDGLDALPELALVAPYAKTIVVSAYAAPRVVAEALRCGAIRYFEKGNLLIDELLSAIVTAFDTTAPTQKSGYRAG